MDLQSSIIMYMEIIGSVAFAISGAVVGIRLKMDLFGVTVLGCCTSVGGGMCRDVILGRLPAFMQNSTYFWIAAFSSVLTFCIIYANQEYLKSMSWHYRRRYDQLLNLTDAIGLAAFTVVGITVTRQAGHGDNYFIQIFMGVLTAAGGGLLRDTMAGERPYIFTKHIYAIASIIGGVVFIIVMEMSNEFAGVISSCVLMILIRLLAAHYRWSLPKIKSM